MKTLDRQDLDRMIDRAQAAVRDPREGLFGPGSVTWRINRESSVLLGGGCAALLQSAHPFVAHGVDQHSAVMSDIQGRFRRTFTNVFALTFGDWPTARATARRIHAVHTHIQGAIGEDVGRHHKGDRYAANVPEALFWVHATLIWTATRVYELLIAPLSAADKDQIMEEARLFGYMFGIPDALVPTTWAAFEDYFDGMIASDTLAVGEPARLISRYLLEPPNLALKPGFEWLRLFNAGLLPPRLRQDYGFAWGPTRDRLFRASARAARLAIKPLPDRLRYFPAYLDARRRLRGEDTPDPVGQALTRVVMRTLVAPRPGKVG